MVKFNSTFLNDLQQKLIQSLSSDKSFSVKIGSETHQFTEGERTELLDFFNSNKQLVLKPPVSDAVVLQRRQDEEFRRRLERALFKSIYPNEWQLDIMLQNLEMYLSWEDKRQRSIVAVYEPYIVRAINALRAKKTARDKKVGFIDEQI